MSDNQVGDTAPAGTEADTLDPALPKRRRGRPAGGKSGSKPESRAETPQQRIDRLKAELRDAEQAKREIEAKRDSIVGGVVVAHALADAGYRRQLATLLRNNVKAKADLPILAELLE